MHCLPRLTTLSASPDCSRSTLWRYYCSWKAEAVCGGAAGHSRGKRASATKRSDPCSWIAHPLVSQTATVARCPYAAQLLRRRNSNQQRAPRAGGFEASGVRYSQSPTSQWLSRTARTLLPPPSNQSHDHSLMPLLRWPSNHVHSTKTCSFRHSTSRARSSNSGCHVGSRHSSKPSLLAQSNVAPTFN